MTASPEGCGVLEHNQLCLCDVIIPETTSDDYLAIPWDYTNGEAIASFGKWDGSLAHWFELLHIARTGLAKFKTEEIMEQRNHDFIFTKLPDDVYKYLVQGIRDGKQPTPLRQEIVDRFQYTISKSYVTKLRQRLERKGLL